MSTKTRSSPLPLCSLSSAFSLAPLIIAVWLLQLQTSDSPIPTSRGRSGTFFFPVHVFWRVKKPFSDDLHPSSTCVFCGQNRSHVILGTYSYIGNHPQIQWHNHNNHLFGFQICIWGKATRLCSVPKLGWLHWKLENPVSRWHLHTTDKLVIAFDCELSWDCEPETWSSSCGPLLGLLRCSQSMVAVFQE